MKNDIMQLKLEDIVPDKFNPRQDFDEEPLKRLESSISKIGIRTPLLVEEIKDGKYLIIDGERRFRMAKKLGLKTIPCRLQETTDAKQRMIVRFNLQEVHESWTPLDKAIAVGELYALTEWSIAEMAAALSMPKSTVGDLLEVNKLSRGTLKRIKKIASYRTMSKLARTLNKVDPANKQLAEEAFVRSVELGKITKDKEANKYLIAILKAKDPQLRKMTEDRKYMADNVLKDVDEEHAWIERTLYNHLMSVRSTCRTVADLIKKNPKFKSKFSDRLTDMLSSTAVVVERLRKSL